MVNLFNPPVIRTNQFDLVYGRAIDQSIPIVKQQLSPNLHRYLFYRLAKLGFFENRNNGKSVWKVAWKNDHWVLRETDFTEWIKSRRISFFRKGTITTRSCTHSQLNLYRCTTQQKSRSTAKKDPFPSRSRPTSLDIKFMIPNTKTSRKRLKKGSGMLSRVTTGIVTWLL